MRTTVIKNFKTLAACALCAAILLQPSLLLAGGAASDTATETTQLENNTELAAANTKIEETKETLGEKLERIYGKHLTELATMLEHLETAVKQYEKAVLMASKLTALDILGLTKFVNMIRKVVKSALGLYDTIENLDEVLEKAYEGHKKNFLDLGFDNIRDFAKARKERYLSDVIAQLKKGTATLEQVETTIKTKYDKNSTTIAATETFMDFFKLIANILNDTFAGLHDLRLSVDLLSDNFSKKEGKDMELERQNDQIDEEWEEIHLAPAVTCVIVVPSEYVYIYY